MITATTRHLCGSVSIVYRSYNMRSLQCCLSHHGAHNQRTKSRSNCMQLQHKPRLPVDTIMHVCVWLPSVGVGLLTSGWPAASGEQTHNMQLWQLNVMSSMPAALSAQQVCCQTRLMRVMLNSRIVLALSGERSDTRRLIHAGGQGKGEVHCHAEAEPCRRLRRSLFTVTV